MSRRVLTKRVSKAHPDYEAQKAAYRAAAERDRALVHDNVTEVIDLVETKRGLSLVLEHVDGCDLFAVNEISRAKDKALSLDLACFVCREVLKGLADLNIRGGMVVGDLTSENVLISRSGEIKLAGEMLAAMIKKPDQSRDVPELIGYMPPEWIAGESLSHSSNVYAVGVMLFELLTGHACFRGRTIQDVLHRIVEEGPPIEELARARVPAGIRDVFERATRLLPGDRFSSAREMEQAIAGDSLPKGKLGRRLADFLDEHAIVR